MALNQTAVALDIDELVLQSFPGLRQLHVTEALDAELTRLFGNQARPVLSFADRAALESLQVPHITLFAPERPEGVDVQVALAVINAFNESGETDA